MAILALSLACGRVVRHEDFLSLVSEAESLGFFTLPDTIANDRSLCPDRATDHPTASITVFRSAGNKHVVDDRGCYPLSDHSLVPIISRLRSLEARVDTVAGSSRWVRPAVREH